MEQFIIPKEEFEKRKFIQFYLLNSHEPVPVFRYAPDDTRVEHMNILSKAIKEFNLESKLVQKEELWIIAPETKDYRLVGAGSCEFAGNKMELWSCSTTYGIRAHDKHLSEIARLYPQIRFEINKERKG